MDHKEQHHQKHVKEREEKKKEAKLHHEQHEKEAAESSGLHPAWFAAVGVLLMIAVILVWTFF